MEFSALVQSLEQTEGIFVEVPLSPEGDVIPDDYTKVFFIRSNDG